MPELITSNKVKARKDHACGYCGGAIKAGDHYQRDVLVYDGRIYTWVSCADCNSMFDDVWGWMSNSLDEGINADDFEEWAWEFRNDPEWGEKARAYLGRRGVAIDEGD